ncbi:hypothetical protein AB0F81_45775 [Actinoplanes sp. NPDC024001]|uniref:hypothetical protein n=1 Tax=Actinoplanes sp. NPDC024001 TaxID=3154598 RepID=UPI0033E2B9AE
MTLRYAARTAGFAAAYLVAFWAAGPLGLALLVPPLVVAAVWLAAQARFGLRRFDVIALATTVMVAASLEGAGLLLAATVGIGAVLPALLFAILLERWLPGYWRGHGDRFRRSRDAVARLAGVAALTAAAGVVLQEVTNPGTGLLQLGVTLLRDTAVLVLLTLATRAVRRTREPRRGLSVVR